MVTAHAAPPQRRVHDPSRAGPERHVRHTPPFRKEQQVAGLVTRAVRRYRDLVSLAELLVAVARQLDATRRVDRLYEPRTIDAPLGAPTPQVWRASTRSSCSRRTFPAATAPRCPSASSTTPRRNATCAPFGSLRRPSVVRMSALSERAVARSAQSSAQSAGPVATYPALSQAM